LVEAGLACHVFDGGAPEPSTEIVEAAVGAAQQANPDVIIGLGGGSNLDVAKVAAVVCVHGGRAADYFGEQRVPGPGLPVIAVPTTAGTGSGSPRLPSSKIQRAGSSWLWPRLTSCRAWRSWIRC
jgi:alcohol dehydrogenase class IV